MPGMIRVRAATLEEVLEATPDDPPTREITRAQAPFWVWRLDGAMDIGSVGAQLPDGTMGSVGELFSRWKGRWVEPDRDDEGGRHRALVAALEASVPPRFRPIVLDDARQIHDGRHRLLAGYEIATKGEFSIEVFWNRPVGPTLA